MSKVNLKEFEKDFQNWLLTRGSNGFKMRYERPQQINKFEIWLQDYLDRLSIKSANFSLVNGTLIMDSVIYDELGKPSTTYEISYTSKTNSPDTISDIKVIL